MISLRNLLKVGFTLAAFVPTLLLAQATRFIVTEAGGTNPLTSTTPLQAGVDANIRVTAVDAAGAVVTTYARDVVVSLPDPLFPDAIHASATILAADFVDGIADNVVITPIHAGTGNRRVAVTDGNIATYNANFDTLGAPAAFNVAPASIQLGQLGTGFQYPYLVNGTLSPLGGYTISDARSFPTRVVAVNADGTIASSYTGTVTLTSTAFTAPVDPDSFDASAVTAGGDTIGFADAHDLQTGNPVVYSVGNGTNTPVDGLTDGSTYYVIRVDATNLKLARTAADATAGTAITFATAGTGSQALQFVGLPASRSVNIGFSGIVDTQLSFSNAGPAQTVGATFPLAPELLFDASAVVAATDTLDLVLPHNLQTGDAVVYSVGFGANTPVDGLTDDTVYYVIKVDDTNLKLALSEADATAGTAITLNNPGTGFQTIRHVSVIVDASGEFDVLAFATTGGIAIAANVDVRTSATVRPGDTISVTYELKATEDVPVDSKDPDGTLSSVTLFQPGTPNSISFLGLSNQFTPQSSATNPTLGRFNITIPTTFPAGTYTLRINSGGVARNSDTTITIQGLSDLAIERFDYAPGTYEGGDVIRFDMAWRNRVISPGQTRNNALLDGAIAYRSEIHLSTDDTFGNEDDILVWTANSSGTFSEYAVSGGLGTDLLPGQSIVINAEFKLPENRPGTYYLYAKVNSGGGRDGNFSSGVTEQVGPTPPNVLQDGNNIVLPTETQKITIVPRTSTETLRVSVSANGAQVNGNSDQAVISRDGAYATFQSLASFGGIGGANGFTQIYRKELSTGTVELVSPGGGSVGAAPTPANGASARPAISADGRYIVFESTSTDLEPGDRNGFSDIYLRDVLEGITRRISRNGAVEANSGCFKPSISADGRFIVFSSRATNLLPGTSSGLSQVYLFDRQVSGAGPYDIVGNTTLTLVSSAAGAAGNSNSFNARISGDSRFVVFTTRATSGTIANNLLGGVAAPFAQVLRWANTAATLALPDAGTLLPISTGGAALADGESDFAAINGDGSQIAFVSRALNLTPGTADTYASGVPHVYRATVSAGVVLSPLTRVNGAGDVEPNNFNQGVASPDLGSFEPSISENGQIIVFASESTNLLPPIPVRHIDRTTYLSDIVQNHADGNFVSDVYLADLSNPGNPLVERASVSSLGYEATLRTTGTTYTVRVPSSRAPTISPDGRYVIFTNDGDRHNALIFNNTNTDLVANYPDSNDSRDIFVFDRKTGLSVPSNLPTVSLLVPPTFTVSTGAIVPLAVQAASATRGIASIEFYANNLLIGTSDTPTVNGSGLYAFNWIVPTAGNGSTFNRVYEIVAVALDSSGGRSLVSNSTRVTVLAQNTSIIPTITLSALSNSGLIRAGSTVKITAVATDTDRNLTGVEFFVNGVSIDDVSRVLAADQTRGVYTTSWTNAGTGYYSILAQARDASGNKVLSQPLTVQIYPNVNPGLPTVSLTTPSATDIALKLGSSLRLVASASDVGGTVAQVRFYANGTLVSLSDTTPYEGLFTPAANGIYEVYAVVVDNDGNESVSPQTVTVTVTSDIEVPLGTGTNDLFVNQVLLDGDRNVQLYPGDPIKYTVAYGRLNPGDQAHGDQEWRTSVYLSTDGDPENDNNFLLTFFDGFYPEEEPGRADLSVISSLLPPNFTGTYYLIATIRVTDGENDGEGDNNTPSVFVTAASRVTILPFDSPTVSRVSSDVDGGDTNEFSESGTISSDGRYIVFQSEATDLVASPTAPVGVSQIYLRDTVTGVTSLISQRGGVAGNAESKYASLSVAGLDQGGARQYFVAYQSAATNLVSGTGNTDSNQQTDVFLYEVATGITTRISVPSGAAPGLQANGGSFLPSISGNGDYVVFESDASNLVAAGATPDTNGQRDIYLYNRNTKAVDALSATSAGVFGAGASTQAQISEDGSTVVFRSFARNLSGSLISPASTRSIIYTKTLGANPTTGTILPISVLREAIGAGAATYTAFNADAFDPTVSANGRYVAFASRATNIPNADGVLNTEAQAQVYVVNRALTGGAFDQAGNVDLTLVSAGRDPVTGALAFGEADSLAPTISANGRYIGYRTEASNLQVDSITRSDGVVFDADDIRSFQDSNNASDVYLRDTGVASITVTSPGAGYPNGSGIEVSITGGGGTGARALAIIENGEVSRIDMLDAGAGYSSAPTVTIPSTGTTQAAAVANIVIASERMSVSQYGQQTIGLIGSTLVPNSRDLKISSDGRYVLFTSDASNNAGFIFGKSNQIPLDSNSKRDIFLVDRKVGAYVTPIEGSAPTVTIAMDGRPVTFGSSRVIRAEAFDGGDFDQATNTAVSGKIQLIEIYANNQLLKRYVPNAPTSADATSAIWLAPLSAGAVQLYAVVEDADGNRSRSQPVNLTVSPPPSLEPTVTLQASATTLNIGQTVTLTATPSDPDNGVKAVRFYGNGSLIATITAAPFATPFIPSSSGTYELLALVYDNAGGGPLDDPTELSVLRNTELSNAVNLLVLAPPAPTVQLVAPAAATTTTVGSSVFIEVSAESNNSNATISTVEIFANGQSIGTASRVGFSSRYRLTWKPAVAGVFNVSATATDTQQSRSSTATRAVTVNAVTGTAPIVVITSPVVDPAFGYATLYTSETTTVQMQALDLDGTVSSVDLYISGRRLGTATRNGANFEYVVDGATLPTGLYELVALATDSSGNISSSAAVPVLVTARSATVSIVRPERPVAAPQLVDVKRGQPVPFLLRATTPDSLTRVTQVALSVNGVNLPTLATAVGTDGDYTLFWTPDATGIFTVVAVATDSIGGTVNSSELEVRVTEPVGTAPVVTLDSPVQPAGTGGVVNPLNVTNRSTILLDSSAVDPDGTIASVEFFVGGKSAGLITSAPYTTTFSTASLPPGSYPVLALATDNQGNKTASTTVTMNVSAQSVSAPSISLAAPAPSSISLGQSSNLSATVTAADQAAITQVVFYANGDTLGTVTTAPYLLAFTAPATGAYTIRAIATDSVGNTSVSTAQTLTVNALVGTAPTVTLTDTTAVKLASGSKLPFTAVVTLGNSPVSTLKFFASNINGGASTLLGSGTLVEGSTTYQLVYTNTLAAGDYTVYAVVTDTNGNIVQSATRSVTSVAVTAPTVRVISPTAGAYNVLDSTTFAAASARVTTRPATNPTFNGDQDITGVVIEDEGLNYDADVTAYIEVRNDPAFGGGVARTESLTVTLGANGIISGLAIASGGNARLFFYQSAVVVIEDNFNIPALTVVTSATAASGVEIVRLYANGVLIGSKASAPYTFAWSPSRAGTYQLHAEVTDSDGITASSEPVTIVINPADDIAPVETLAAIENAYQAILGRSPTNEETVSAVDRFGVTLSSGQVAALLLQSSDFRDDQGELILSHLAVWGEYPTASQYAALETQRDFNLTDVQIVDALLASVSYKERYGNIADLNTVNSNQYNRIRALALRTYRNLYGKDPSNSATANAVAKQFFYNIATLLQTPGQAVVNFTNENFAGGKSGTTLTRLRMAGAILLIGNEQPTKARIDAFAGLPLAAVADYYFDGGAPFSAGTVVSIETAEGTEAAGTTYYASGLPKGLTIDRTTGVISGRLPSTAKAYAITFWTQVNGVRGATATRVLVVEPLDSKFVGTNDVLLLDADGLPAGKLSVKVAGTASYTGTLIYRDGRSYSFKGVLSVLFDEDGESTAYGEQSPIKRKAPLSALQIGLFFDADGRLSASVTEGDDIDPIAEGEAIRVFTFTKSAPAPWQGTRAVNLTDISSETFFLDGAGSGTLKVANTGVLSVSLKGADGAKITGSASSSIASEYRLYSRPYSKKPEGYFAGSIKFSDEATPALVEFPADDNDLTWFRPAGLAPYGEGFGPLKIQLDYD